MDKIEVYVCEPGNKQYYAEIDNTLEAMQEMVGGYVEQIRIPYLAERNIFVMADEGAYFKSKEQCIWIDTAWVLGKCFFVKQRGQNHTSLGKKDKEAIEKYMSGELDTQYYHNLSQLIANMTNSK